MRSPSTWADGIHAPARSSVRVCAVLLLIFAGLFDARAYLPGDVSSVANAYTNAFYTVSGTNGYFKERLTGGVTYFWQLANEIESVIDAYECTSNTAYIGMTTNLLNGFLKNNSGNWTSWNIYNDDIMWAVMAFARGGQISGRTNYYTIAKANFDATYARGWDMNLGGGLYWTTGKFSKNACVNGPGAIAAYLLYQIYGDTNYWNKATNLYFWERATLYNPVTGRVYDNINTNGNVDQVPITYNQGTFIGAADLLGQTNDALLAATYTMNTMGSAGYLPRYGIAQNNSIFNSIFIRWMTKFMKNRGIQAPFQLWLQGNANAAWNGRRASDNLSWCQWPQATPEGTNFYSYDCISSFEVMLTVPPTQTTNPTLVTLLASDGSGSSSFESGLNWSDSTAPSAAHDYLVSGYTLRSPQDGANHFFAGSSLTLSNGALLACKNTSGGKGVAVGTSLVLDGGEVANWAGNSTEFSGKVTLGTGGGRIDPQGNTFTISALIGGPGALRIKAADAGHLNGTVIVSGFNTYTGGTIIDAAHTVRLSGLSTLGSTNSALSFSNSAGLGHGSLDLNTVSLRVGNLSGMGGRIFNNSTNGVSTLSVGNGDADGFFRGSLVDGAGSVKFEKAGAGIMTLAGSTNVCEGGLNVFGGALVVTSNAALNVGAGAGTAISIGSGNFGAGTLSGTLDVSAASNFTANVETIQVGVNSATAGTVTGSAGVLKLGTNNNLFASNTIVIGDSAGVFNSTLQSATTAANGVTTIMASSLTVGGRKANAAFILGSNAQLNLGAATNRLALGVGHAAPLGQIATGTSFSAMNDLSAGLFKGVLNRLTIGTINNNGGGGEIGTMILSANPANELDISGPGNVLLIGTNSTVNSATATGTLTISNLAATSMIASTDNSTAILLGANLRTSGILNLLGGTLTLKTTGAAIAGGAGASVLNLDGATLRAGTNSATFITNLSAANVLAGGVTVDTAGFNVTIAQALLNSGGGLTKSGAGTLILTKANSYAGATVVRAGTLALAEPGAITSSAFISISNDAILDVTGRGDQTLSLGSGKSLSGSGKVVGNLAALDGSTVNPGDTVGDLTVEGDVVLGGLLVMELNRTNTQNCDQLMTPGGTLTVGGALVVTNLGPALLAGDIFPLFAAPVAGFSQVVLPPLEPGLVWINKLNVDGTIALVRSTATNSTNITAYSNGDLLSISWPADHIGWRLQTQSNDVTTGLGTNWVDIIDSTATNQMFFPMDARQGGVFFRLKFP